MNKVTRCFVPVVSLFLMLHADEHPIRNLTLDECRQLVLLNNFEIASRELGMASAQRLFKGEKGAVWEPELVLGAAQESNERENNTEEFISQGVEDFEEDNVLWNVALEQPLITGGAVTIGYNVDNLDNNLLEQREIEEDEFQEKEYDSFAGISIIQPLLRNGGLTIAKQVVDMAKEESDIAFQEYRRQLMQSLGQAEAAYWELGIAQERVELRKRSVEVARTILEDNRIRVKAGKMSELEVKEAEAGLATRESQLLEAQQSLTEASDRLLGFFALPEDYTQDVELRVLDAAILILPEMAEMEVLYNSAQTLHPDLLIRQNRINQDQLRVDYASNQRLPQLDLRASYGYNGLGNSYSGAWDAVTDQDFPSWTLGLEVRVPLGGGQRKRAELFAAKNRLEQSRLDRLSVEQQVMRQLQTARSRVVNFYKQAENYEAVSELNLDILDTELVRLDAGRSDSRKVLEAEEDLTRAREAYEASLTRLAVAQIELYLTSGTLLTQLGLDPMLEDDNTDSVESQDGEQP